MMPENSEPMQVVLFVADVLENLRVPYVIVGSFASAVHGVARATMDADILADLHEEHLQTFIAALQTAFYVDEEMIRDAVTRRGSFNLIHSETFFKVDIFVSRERIFEKDEIKRRVAINVSDEPPQSAYFASAEDVVLAKLEWYRLGGEVSDRQWNDILGILKVQASTLDKDYLANSARALIILDLLDRALAEAGIGSDE
jgi:hypothetical protein